MVACREIVFRSLLSSKMGSENATFAKVLVAAVSLLCWESRTGSLCRGMRNDGDVTLTAVLLSHLAAESSGTFMY